LLEDAVLVHVHEPCFLVEVESWSGLSKEAPTICAERSVLPDNLDPMPHGPNYGYLVHGLTKCLHVEAGSFDDVQRRQGAFNNFYLATVPSGLDKGYTRFLQVNPECNP
jgi:hypothetical protein